MMERLNKKGKETLLEIANKLGAYQKTNLTPDEIKAMQSELSEYKQKLADGRMIELPCKVGDIVYLVNHEFKSRLDGEPMKFQVDEFSTCKVGGMHMILNSCEALYAMQICKIAPILEFNKTVFLTKEDAEKAVRNERTNSND